MRRRALLPLLRSVLLAACACKPAADPPATAEAAPSRPAAAAPTEPLSFPELAVRCAGPEGVTDCPPGAFEETFRGSLPWLRARRDALEALWLEELAVAHHAAYGLAWLKSERALPRLRERLLADRSFYGWETDDPDDLEVRMRDDQYIHHLAYIAAIEHISGEELADAVALQPDERDRLARESLGAPPEADVARWLLRRTLRPAAPVEPRSGAQAATPIVFADGCWEARASTRAEALQRCRAARGRGDAWTRRRCRCAPEDLIEVGAGDPVAFYHYSYVGAEIEACGGQGPTPIAAWRACAAAQLQRQLQQPGEACACPERGPTAVLGPYTRRRAVGEFDAAEDYVYLDSVTGRWVDRRGEEPCFVAGTPVATPAGPRPIEALRPGDRVLARDPGSAKDVVATVVAIRSTPTRDLLRLSLANGRELTTTPNHPFYAPLADEWVEAGALRAGDRVLARGSDGVTAPVAVRGARRLDEAAQVHSISVTAPHTYFAGDALVHNY